MALVQISQLLAKIYFSTSMNTSITTYLPKSHPGQLMEQSCTQLVNYLLNYTKSTVMNSTSIQIFMVHLFPGKLARDLISYLPQPISHGLHKSTVSTRLGSQATISLTRKYYPTVFDGQAYMFLPVLVKLSKDSLGH